jgi:hypothetical protein
VRWRRARVTAEGARALARVRQEVVRVEEEGLRLAEELSEDRLSQGWWVNVNPVLPVALVELVVVHDRRRSRMLVAPTHLE